MNSNDFKDSEHRAIWDFLNNHVISRIRRIEDRQFKMLLTGITLGGGLIIGLIGLILALLKIIP